MTAPLVPASTNLRNFPRMPLDVARLCDSKIVSTVTGDEFRCAVLLWCKAWHQIPAGSLPNDEEELAKYAGMLGENQPPPLRKAAMKVWGKLRNGAMYGWIMCTDGRWYHPVIAEMVLAAIDAKDAQKAKTRAATEARERKRHEIEKARASQRDDERHEARDEQRDEQRDDSRNEVQGKGREGKGIEKKEKHSAARQDSKTLAEPTEAGRACLLMREWCGMRTNPSDISLVAAIAEGITPEMLADTAREGSARAPPPNDLFRWAIAAARSRHAAGPQPIHPGNTHHATPSRSSAAGRIIANAKAAEERERIAAGDG
jgi:hypothetical protein